MPWMGNGPVAKGLQPRTGVRFYFKCTEPDMIWLTAAFRFLFFKLLLLLCGKQAKRECRGSRWEMGPGPEVRQHPGVRWYWLGWGGDRTQERRRPIGEPF